MVSTKSKIILACLIFILSTYGLFHYVNSLTLKSKLNKKYHTEVNEKTLVDLRKIIDSEIDSIFIFFSGITNIEISKALKINYSKKVNLKDEQQLVLIVYDREIVFEEIFWNNDYSFEGGEIIDTKFNVKLDNPYVCFSTSYFYVKKSKDNGYLFQNVDNVR